MGLNNEDIKQLISILQRGLTEDESKKTEKSNKSIKPKSKNIKTKPERFNTFEDMPEMHMFKSDTIIDQKLQKRPPTPRTRNYKPISVICRTCGKKENVSPTLLDSVDRYKCNKCSSSPGG
jgi:hypothetical protein